MISLDECALWKLVFMIFMLQRSNVGCIIANNVYVAI